MPDQEAVSELCVPLRPHLHVLGMLDHIHRADLCTGDVFELHVFDGTAPIAPHVDKSLSRLDRHILH